MLEAVVFDFDGVIIDTEWSAFEIWNQLFAEHGTELTLDEFVRSIGTRGAIDFSALITEKTGRPAPNNRALRAWKQPLQDAAVADLALMPGVASWLQATSDAQIRTAIASSSERWWIEPHLERHAIAHHFEHLSTWDGPDVGFSPKPAPDLYTRCLAALGIHPSAAVAIEDSINGTVAAKRAGMSVIAVPTRLTAHLDFAIADVVVSSLAELDLHRAIAALSNTPTVRITDYDAPAAAALALAQQAELAARWDDDPPCGAGGHADEYRGVDGRFLVVNVDGADVACGGLRRHDVTTGEVKRVYVTPSARGRGLSRKVMAHLVLAARDLGYERLILETGDRLPEAISLYESSGWTRIANFGEYADSPDSRCYELRLLA